MRNRLLLLIISAQLGSFGRTLIALDSDTKGNDDIIGQVLSASGGALGAYASGSESGFRRYLKIAADAIYEFLGLTPPQSV